MGAELQAVEKKVGVFLTAHHIVLYIALALSLTLGVYFVESKVVDLAEAKAQAAQQALAVEKDHSAQLAVQYAANQAQRDKENAQFLATIAQLQTQAKVQIIHDKALPPPELGQRIETVEGFKAGTISVDPNSNLVVPVPLAQKIVADLDQAKADADTVMQQASIIKNDEAANAELQRIIAEDKKVLATQIEADKKELTAVKAKARKSKLKWFFAGVVTGFLGRNAVKY